MSLSQSAEVILAKAAKDSSTYSVGEALGVASACPLPLSERGELLVSLTGMITASLLDGLIGRLPTRNILTTLE